VNSYAKQCNKRLHELRMLGNLQIDGTMVDLFYKSTVEKHVKFCIAMWFLCTKVSDRKVLERIIKSPENHRV